MKQFNKGQSNPSYFIQDANGDRWVLRKQPPGVLLRGAHQVIIRIVVFYDFLLVNEPADAPAGI